MTLRVMLSPHRIPGSILNTCYSLNSVSYVLPVFVKVSFEFSGVLPTSKKKHVIK